MIPSAFRVDASRHLDGRNNFHLIKLGVNPAAFYKVLKVKLTEPTEDLTP
jgi:hypothetical protein